MSEQTEMSTDWLAGVREEFERQEIERQSFRVGLESRDLSCLRDQDWGELLIPSSLPRIIWMYWAQGWDAAPEITQACRASWLHHNPDWEIRLLDDSTYRDYVDIDDIVCGKEMELPHRADVLRLRLLGKFGGVWVDATTFCTRPLSHWLPVLMQSGFFAFSHPRPDRYLSNWFLASVAGGEMVRIWLELIKKYWSQVDRADHYFWAHYLFGYGCQTNPKMGAGWRATPHLSAHGALQPQVLAFDEEAEAGVVASIKENLVPVVKLTYRTNGVPAAQAALGRFTDLLLGTLKD